jgi:hypothetical protein
MKPVHLLAFMLIAPSIRAQVPTVDLTMSDNGKGQVEFRIRLDQDFDGIMSSLTYTVRWPASAGVALDTAVRCYPFQDVVPVNAVLPAVNEGWMYRTFNGFSLSVLADNDLVWQAGREYPICTADILVPGTTMELVNDAWTSANNRDFFSSLNALEATGILYASPEPDVSIRSQDEGTGNLDIILTPETDFFGWVTDLDFTVRWPAGSGVSLGTTLQNEEVAEYLPIGKIGPEVTAGGFTYQRFHGEGIKSIANSDDAWHAGMGVTALSVPIFGTAQGIGVVNDEWTMANSGNYTIKLNSHGHTGLIEGIALGLATAPKEPFEASVTSAANGFNLVLDLPGTAHSTTLSLHNAAGQAIWSTTREGAHGRVNLMAETGPVCDGLYILSVRHGERSLTKRVVR